jgi:hypothetical protein
MGGKREVEASDTQREAVELHEGLVVRPAPAGRALPPARGDRDDAVGSARKLGRLAPDGSVAADQDQRDNHRGADRHRMFSQALRAVSAGRCAAAGTGI